MWLPPSPARESRLRKGRRSYLGRKCVSWWFAIDWMETISEVKAACYGTTAGSFALEHNCLPSRMNLEDGRELWNKVEV